MEWVKRSEIQVSSASRPTGFADPNHYQVSLSAPVPDVVAFRIRDVDMYATQYPIEDGVNDTFSIYVATGAGATGTGMATYTYSVVIPSGFWADPAGGDPQTENICDMITALFAQNANDVADDGGTDWSANCVLDLEWDRTLTGLVHCHIVIDGTNISAMTYRIVDTPLARALGFTDFTTVRTATTTAYTELNSTTTSGAQWDGTTGARNGGAEQGFFADRIPIIHGGRAVYLCISELANTKRILPSTAGNMVPGTAIAKIPINVAPGQRLFTEYCGKDWTYLTRPVCLQTLSIELRNVDGSMYATHGLDHEFTIDVEQQDEAYPMKRFRAQ